MIQVYWHSFKNLSLSGFWIRTCKPYVIIKKKSRSCFTICHTLHTSALTLVLEWQAWQYQLFPDIIPSRLRKSRWPWTSHAWRTSLPLSGSSLRSLTQHFQKPPEHLFTKHNTSVNHAQRVHKVHKVFFLFSKIGRIGWLLQSFSATMIPIIRLPGYIFLGRKDFLEKERYLNKKC